jgi:hypothetical protein
MVEVSLGHIGDVQKRAHLGIIDADKSAKFLQLGKKECSGSDKYAM